MIQQDATLVTYRSHLLWYAMFTRAAIVAEETISLWRMTVNAKERVLPQINLELCSSCGTCVDTCPSEAVALIDERPVIVHPEDCAYCGDCEDLCPEGAISLPYEIVFE
jgi:formate hydrogenlyase subunit 6/NADH:ubiquinone oxidoreductase subunit I